MPESKVRKTKSKKQSDSASAKQAPSATPPAKQGPTPSPRWWAPTMVALMLAGLLWTVVFYLTSTRYPIPASYLPSPNYNLIIGLGLILVGFVMTSRWR